MDFTVGTTKLFKAVVTDAFGNAVDVPVGTLTWTGEGVTVTQDGDVVSVAAPEAVGDFSVSVTDGVLTGSVSGKVVAGAAAKLDVVEVPAPAPAA